jgi:hypothetical protein
MERLISALCSTLKLTITLEWALIFPRAMISNFTVISPFFFYLFLFSITITLWKSRRFKFIYSRWTSCTSSPIVFGFLMLVKKRLSIVRSFVVCCGWRQVLWEGKVESTQVPSRLPNKKTFFLSLQIDFISSA